jgi:hypothetical protein
MQLLSLADDFTDISGMRIWKEVDGLATGDRLA